MKENKEEFKEWRSVIFASPNYLGKDLALEAWNHQQQKIDALNARLEKAMKCIEFYADKKEWKGTLHLARIGDYDTENMGTFNCGGKRARQCLKELGE